LYGKLLEKGKNYGKHMNKYGKIMEHMEHIWNTYGTPMEECGENIMNHVLVCTRTSQHIDGYHDAGSRL